MKSEPKLTLNKDQYNLTTYFSSYENMQKNKNDRYQSFYHIIILIKQLFPNY